MSEPEPTPSLATCCVGASLVLLVKSLEETDAKRNKCASDLLGEVMGIIKEGVKKEVGEAFRL